MRLLLYLLLSFLFLNSCSTNPKVELGFTGHKTTIEISFIQEGKSEFIKEISVGRPHYELNELNSDELDLIKIDKEGSIAVVGYKLEHTESDFGQKPLNQEVKYFYILKNKNGAFVIYEYLKNDDAHMILKVIAGSSQIESSDSDVNPNSVKDDNYEEVEVQQSEKNVERSDEITITNCSFVSKDFQDEEYSEVYIIIDGVHHKLENVDGMGASTIETTDFSSYSIPSGALHGMENFWAGLQTVYYAIQENNSIKVMRGYLDEGEELISFKEIARF